mmetsp:Transcript_40498/g.128157  ORF Transcript_40498/g.128157 Transcript_40498/m.128157 type:complete len:261 (-) Transcript_40498:3084-3866(-)
MPLRVERNTRLQHSARGLHTQRLDGVECLRQILLRRAEVPRAEHRLGKRHGRQVRQHLAPASGRVQRWTLFCAGPCQLPAFGVDGMVSMLLPVWCGNQVPEAHRADARLTGWLGLRVSFGGGWLVSRHQVWASRLPVGRLAGMVRLLCNLWRRQPEPRPGGCRLASERWRALRSARQRGGCLMQCRVMPERMLRWCLGCLDGVDAVLCKLLQRLPIQAQRHRAGTQRLWIACGGPTGSVRGLLQSFRLHRGPRLRTFGVG